MLAILSAVFGFAAPFIPEVIRLFTRKQDHAFEMERMRLSLEISKHEHTWRMAELESRADIEEMKMLHQPAHSFGVDLLDAAQGWGMTKWLFVPGFYLFLAADWVNSMVRPTIAYAAFAGYLAFKWAQFQLATTYVSGETLSEKLAQAVATTWTENDWGVLLMVLGYYFGGRIVKARFGGSATSASTSR